MNELAPSAPRSIGLPTPGAVVWVVAILACVALWQLGRAVAPWAFEYPSGLIIPANKWISAFTKWLLNDATFGLFTFKDITRFVSDVIDVPYRVALSLLSTGLLSGSGSAAVQLTPSLSWIAVIGVFSLMGLHAGGKSLAIIVAACLLFIVLFGQWDAAMITLASVLVAVPLGVGGGLLFGLLAYRSRWFETAISPVLDLMQTIPVFAYLVPILFLFGFGPTAAVLATLIFAMPPMIRVTLLALRRVPAELRELGQMIGCTPRQMTWRVLVPSAKDALMVGVNQVIMLSLNMVIIAAMIGAGGLGFDVLAALRRLDFGAGLESGLAIVAIAIVLDRLSQAYARRTPDDVPQGNWAARHPYLIGGAVLVVVTALIGMLIPAVQQYPVEAELTTGTFMSGVMERINVNYFDALEGFKNALLLNLLVPFKRFLLDLPWVGVTALLALAGWRLGGFRLALMVGLMTFAIAAVGLWEEAMITVYLCGISTVIAMLIGLPIGIISAERAFLWRWVEVVIDTLQTLPAFVYLMPAVMLFRVGDFTAMIAVVAFAVVPAVRYTALGLRGVDPRLVEAGRSMGCTNWQILTRIKLRLALPELLLGLNQTIMFALSMLVITALVGTRDLGQEVYVALTKADPGSGLVAGLCVAFIAIIADRLITAGALRARANLGLTDASH